MIRHNLLYFNILYGQIWLLCWLHNLHMETFLVFLYWPDVVFRRPRVFYRQKLHIIKNFQRKLLKHSLTIVEFDLVYWLLNRLQMQTKTSPKKTKKKTYCRVFTTKKKRHLAVKKYITLDIRFFVSVCNLNNSFLGLVFLYKCSRLCNQLKRPTRT